MTDLPPEPPNGTILMGAHGDVWTRRDPDPRGIHPDDQPWLDRWTVTRLDYDMPWADAYRMGADPNRKLEERRA